MIEQGKLHESSEDQRPAEENTRASWRLVVPYRRGSVVRRVTSRTGNLQEPSRGPPTGALPLDGYFVVRIKNGIS